MDGLARTSGRLCEAVEVNGKQYTLRPPSAVDILAGIENRILAGREDPLLLAAKACRTAPADQHEAIWRAAMRLYQNAKKVSQEDASQFLNTIDGIVFVTWLCLKEGHAEEFPTPEVAREFLLSLDEAKLDEFAVKFRLASGLHDLGNSSGPSRPSATRAAEGESTADQPAS